MSGYGVDPATLVAAGGRFVDIADEARQAQARFTGAVSGFDGENAGFTAMATAAAVAMAWEHSIGDMCKRAALAGGLLTEAADGYEAMESAVVESLPPLSAGD